MQAALCGWHKETSWDKATQYSKEIRSIVDGSVDIFGFTKQPGCHKVNIELVLE